MADFEEISTGHVKCIRQPVLIAAQNVTYHSSLQKESQFTAKNAIEKESRDSNCLKGVNSLQTLKNLIAYRN